MKPDADSFFLMTNLLVQYLEMLEKENYSNPEHHRHAVTRYLLKEFYNFQSVRRSNNCALTSSDTYASIIVASRDNNMAHVAALLHETDRLDYSRSMPETILSEIRDAFVYWRDNNMKVETIPKELRSSLVHFVERNFGPKDQKQFSTLFH